jgi:lysophospholipase L1-like esterase
MSVARWFPPVVLLAALACAAASQAQESKKNAAVVPVPREGNWVKRHESINERAKQGEVGLIFLGDSITQGWEGLGKEVWEKYYGKRNAVNMGINGDRTQHVLWRLDNGNVDGITPKAAVLMIGTNNSNGSDFTAEEIAEGIGAIVKKLNERLPDTKVLILGIFPRGEKALPNREKIARTNEIVSKLADKKQNFYLDIGKKFLDDDGNLSREMMPDLLHLNPKSYAIWAEAIEEKLVELLDEKDK